MKVSVCVLVFVASAFGQGPTIQTNQGSVNVNLPANSAFSVVCPGANAVVCEGDGVKQVDGKCMADGKLYTMEEGTANIETGLGVQQSQMEDALVDFEEDVKNTTAMEMKKVKDEADSRLTMMEGKVTDGQAAVNDMHDDMATYTSSTTNQLNTAIDGFNTDIADLENDVKDKVDVATFVADLNCRKEGKAGYDMTNKKCFEPVMTGSSCLDIFNKNVKAKTDYLLRDGIYTIKIGNADRKVYCDMEGSFDNGSPGWTMVARISRFSRKHMVNAAYGTLVGPNQPKPWKLSNAEINTLRTTNKNQAGALTSAFKFFCTAASSSHTKTGSTYSGYQYFHRDCVFNANVGNAGNNVKCSSWTHREYLVQYYSGYRDGNSCGLGGHHAGNSFAAYGWHYCNRESTVRSQGESMSPSYSTGCGHNYAWRSGIQQSGDGLLWIR
jgi:hypothetical protein